MARREVVDCDCCGRMIRDPHTIGVIVDRVTDEAGSMDNVTEPLDLCSACMTDAVHQLLDRLTYVERQLWLKVWRKRT